MALRNLPEPSHRTYGTPARSRTLAVLVENTLDCLAGMDMFVIAGTGAGKSLTFAMVPFMVPKSITWILAEPKWVTYLPEIKADPDDLDAGVLPYYFNINSDVAVKSFTSDDSQNAKGGGLTVNLPASYSLTGMHRFTGTVGAGKIYIKLTNGIVIKGPILEGPAEGSSFVGAGGWAKG